MDQLIDSLIAGNISEQDYEDLVQRLKEDPQARRSYISEMRVEHLLQDLSDPEHEPTGTLRSGWPSVIPSGLSAPWPVISTIVLGLVVFGVFGLLIYRINRPDRGTSEMISEAGSPDGRQLSGNGPSGMNPSIDRIDVARVTNGDEMEWNQERPIVLGRRLSPGHFELTSGNVEITFDSGAVVNLEGNSAFEIVDAKEILLEQGSIEVNVPSQTTGFRVRTNSDSGEKLPEQIGFEFTDSDARLVTEPTGARDDNNGGNTISGALIGVNTDSSDNIMLYRFSGMTALQGQSVIGATVEIYVHTGFSHSQHGSDHDVINLSEIALPNLGWISGTGTITEGDTPADDGTVSFLNRVQFSGSGQSEPWLDVGGQGVPNLLGALKPVSTAAGWNQGNAPAFVSFSVDGETAQRWVDDGLAGLAMHVTDDGDSRSRFNMIVNGARIMFDLQPHR